MKILLSGARGFTGKYFRELAVQLGHTVYDLKSNIRDEKGLTTEVATIQPEAVVHLAAITHVMYNNPSEFESVNVQGTENLLYALSRLANLPKSILVASSANVYGNCANSPISENEVLDPTNDYARSKVRTELVARSYQERLPIMITRPFNYTGRGQSREFIIPKLIYHFKNKIDKISLGNLFVEREYLDVRFVVRAYISLLERGVPGEVYNICEGKVYNLEKIIDELRLITNHNIDILQDERLIRENEIRSLTGDNRKLMTTIGRLNEYHFLDTINWMLAE